MNAVTSKVFFQLKAACSIGNISQVSPGLNAYILQLLTRFTQGAPSIKSATYPHPLQIAEHQPSLPCPVSPIPPSPSKKGVFAVCLPTRNELL